MSAQIHHHVLDLRVVLQRVGREVLAVAGLLVAAVRHLRGERDVVVDPDAAEAERLRDPQRPADVARPDRGGEPVSGPIRPLDRLLLAGEGLQASSKGARVRYTGARRTVIDGPFAEAKELIAGFWLIQTKSKEEALEWARRVPFDDGEVEVDVDD